MSDDLYPRLPGCPAWCLGHENDDRAPEARSHTTEYEHFGPEGVAVVQEPGGTPVVDLQTAIMDWTPARLQWTPERAELLAFQILQAAALARRYAERAPLDEAIQRLGELLGGAAQ